MGSTRWPMWACERALASCCGLSAAVTGFLGWGGAACRSREPSVDESWSSLEGDLPWGDEAASCWDQQFQGLEAKKKIFWLQTFEAGGLIAKSDWMEKALAEKYHCWCFTNISIAKAAGRKCFGLKMSVHQTVSYSGCFTDRTRLQKWVTAHPDSSDQRCPYCSVLVCNPSWYYRTAAASRGSKCAVVLL